MSTFHGPPIWIQAYVGGSPPRQCVSNYEGALMPTPLNFGIDVAKDTLQIAWAESRRSCAWRTGGAQLLTGWLNWRLAAASRWKRLVGITCCWPSWRTRP